MNTPTPTMNMPMTPMAPMPTNTPPEGTVVGTYSGKPMKVIGQFTKTYTIPRITKSLLRSTFGLGSRKPDIIITRKFTLMVGIHFDIPRYILFEIVDPTQTIPLKKLPEYSHVFCNDSRYYNSCRVYWTDNRSTMNITFNEPYTRKYGMHMELPQDEIKRDPVTGENDDKYFSDNETTRGIAYRMLSSLRFNRAAAGGKRKSRKARKSRSLRRKTRS
jgi:hypothetical protein